MTTPLAASVVAAALFTAAAGAMIAYRRRSVSPDGSSDFSGTDGSQGGDGGVTSDAPSEPAASGPRGPDGANGRPDTSVGDANAAFDDRIGERTLDRLEPVVPDAVGRVRDQRPFDRNAAPNGVDAIERDLRQAIKDALDHGRFDPTVTSSLGGTYDVVNLPARFRELAVPPAGETVHVADLDTVVREALDDWGLHAAARTVAAVHDHCRDIESHVRRHEEPYLEERREVERTLGDVRDMTDRFDDTLADRVREFVVDGRHESLPGVRDIERRLDAADRSLYACAFDDAHRVVRDAARAGDDLLMAVDFLGGVTGTIEHGIGRVRVPDGVATSFVADLVPLLERQYAVDVEFDGDELVVTDGSDPDDGASSQPDHGESRPGGGGSGVSASAGSASTTEREASGSRERLTPDAVADEILFVFRELGDRGGNDAVECQTERLPDAVARREVLEPLATFCRRQTDLVESVTLQENAPPGFFEIEFREGTPPSTGLDALRERFTERHGG